MSCYIMFEMNYEMSVNDCRTATSLKVYLMNMHGLKHLGQSYNFLIYFIAIIYMLRK